MEIERVKQRISDVQLSPNGRQVAFTVQIPDLEKNTRPTQIYVIPIDDATRTQGTLRIDPTANGQNKRVRWARDYELPA